MTQATFDLHRNLASKQAYLCHFTSTCRRLRNISAPLQFRRATNAGYTWIHDDPVDIFLRSLATCEYSRYVKTLDIRLGIPTWRDQTITRLNATLTDENFPAVTDLRIHVHDSSDESMAKAIVTAFAITSPSDPPAKIRTLHLSHTLALGLSHLFPHCTELDLGIPSTTEETPLIHPLLTTLSTLYPHLLTLILPGIRGLHTGVPFTLTVPRHLRGTGAEGKAQLRLIREREKEEQASAVAGTAFKEFRGLEKLCFGIPASFGTGEEMVVFERAKGGGEVVRGVDESVFVG